MYRQNDVGSGWMETNYKMPVRSNYVDEQQSSPGLLRFVWPRWAIDELNSRPSKERVERIHITVQQEKLRSGLYW